MGTAVSIHVRGPDPGGPAVAGVVRACFDELRWVEEVFSLYRPASPLSRLRRGELAIEQAVALHPEIGEVIDLCQEATHKTHGSFSWLLPDAEGALLIEPTGLVKGWAVARCADRLERLAGHAYCINAGGDIAVGGLDATAGGDRPWRIGLEDPTDTGAVARVVALRQGAVATSGTAARGAHLVDPRTGERVGCPGSVSVVGPSVLWADVWATALFVGPDDLVPTALQSDAWQVIRL